MIKIKKTVGAALFIDKRTTAYPGDHIQLDMKTEEALIKRGLAEKIEASEAEDADDIAEDAAEETAEDEIPDLKPEEPVKTTSRRRKK